MAEAYATVFEVPAGTRHPTPFSPQLEPEAVGIRISAPPEVSYSPGESALEGGSFAYVPVSVTYRFSMAYGSRFGVIESHMTVMAVNASSGASYVAVLQQEDMAAVPREYPRVPRERLEQSFFTRYFTINLVDHLGLPMEEATYHVHLGLEAHQSNVATVVLKKRR
ncbi:hypothetical protein [Pyxidicoccus caerfyrddinensis]|uniref:hypothetical protein n=1 Tax=Pyxidicoccus caerfyrddinensis TaxID=2709663 RepID=UPI0013DD2365|nr:hypothetical protein [Pyxidicoccus caerfyrddinensis]